MDAVFVIDQELVTNAVQTLAIQALTAHQNGVQISWQDAELAAYLVFIFGEINKSASPRKRPRACAFSHPGRMVR